MLQRFLFFILVFSALIIAGAATAQAMSKKPVADVEAPRTIEPLVSPKLLSHVDLRADWQIKLPIKESENIERMFIFGKNLYVLTDRNYMFCINAQSGTARFELQLAAPGLPIYPPQYYDGRLWFMIGTQIVVFDPATGKRTQTDVSSVGNGAACGLSRNDEYIYAAGADKRLHAIGADEYLQKFVVSADNDSRINSVIADNEFVIFSTVVGNIVSISSTEPKKIWQFDVSGEITAPLVRDKEWLYVSSKNAKVYKLDALTGNSGWGGQFHAGAPLTQSVVAGAEAVYQYAGDEGLYAVSKADGKMLWHLDNGVSLICEAGKLAYVFAEPPQMVVMDNRTKKKLYAVNFAAVSKHAVNTIDSTMYLADDKGRVMSINRTDR